MRGFVALVIVCVASVASATSYGPPQKRDVRSPDGAFVLHVDPTAQRLTVTTVGDPATPLWSVERQIQYEDFFLARGGHRAAIVSWRFVQVDKLGEPAVEILDARGRVTFWSVEDLIAQPPTIRGVGPIGPFWREWLETVHQDGDRLVVETTGLHRYTFDIALAVQLDSELRPVGVALLASGYTMLVLAALIVWWTRRAARGVETPIEKRRYAWAVAPPIAALVWLWIHLAGVPLLPAEYVETLRLVAAVIALILVPVALLAIVRLPPGTRWLRVLLALASPVVIAVVVVLWW